MFIELLKEIERCVLKRDYMAMRPPLLKLFEQVEAGKIGFGGQSDAFNIISEKEATRVAAVVTTTLTDPNFDPTVTFMLELNRFKRALVQIFEISGYRGTGHFVDLLLKPTAETQTYRRLDLLKMFAGLSINAMNDTLLKILFQIDKQYALPTVLGFLSEQLVYTTKAEEIRSKLLASADHWIGTDLRPYTVMAIGPAYMGCSYAEAAHKHDIKRCFNDVVHRWFNTLKIATPTFPETRVIKDKPNLVIFAELYNSGHAMHRCYGPSIKALKQRFNTTLLIGDTGLSRELLDFAHHVEVVKTKHSNPGIVIEKILSFKPDIVYYPSIGMRFSTITTSTIRLAPIQIMTIGHPATTMSDAIDYIIMPDALMKNEDTCSEHIMLRPTKPYFIHRTDAAKILPNIRRNADIVRIAVPAWSRKITPTFLNTCRRIRDLAKTPVEFWFFPNASGALHQALVRRYSHLMPQDKVLPRKGYNDYIHDLNQCDIFLSTFPFGATNSIVDAALQGLPIVNLLGDEPHTANDASLVTNLAQPDWLTAPSVDAYVSAAVRLIDEPNLRTQICMDILASDPEKAFFVEDGEEANEFATIVDFLYHSHETIQETGPKCWQYQDILDGKATSTTKPRSAGTTKSRSARTTNRRSARFAKSNQ